MESPAIGVLNESPLHAALKESIRQPGDAIEVPVGGFVIDLVHDGTLVEIQTGSFSSMREKLDHLLDAHRFRIVHPIAVHTDIVNLEADGRVRSRRKSPKSGVAADVCAELVSFPTLLSHPNFELVIALTREEDHREPATHRRRRSRPRVGRRRLVRIESLVSLSEPRDLVELVPDGLPEPFTTAELATALGRSRSAAQQVAYCLRTAGVVEAVGRDRNGVAYSLSATRPS